VHGHGPVEGQTRTRIAGAFAYWRESGRFVLFEAPAVVDGDGGSASPSGHVNFVEYTGDANALRLRAGGRMINMEFCSSTPKTAGSGRPA